MSAVADRLEPTSVAHAVDRVRARIEAAGGDPARVRLVAVTKGQPAAAVDAVAEAGVMHVGESYPQELLAKLPEVTAPVQWHWIGRLQRNKVRQLAGVVSLWESVDRAELASEIARRAPGASILVQVNVSGSVAQGGCPPVDVPELVARCQADGLDVRGLMAIGAQGHPDAVRAGFRSIRELADRLGLPERSMGMSSDLEFAIAEGSTSVRIGSALFGTRGGTPAVGT